MNTISDGVLRGIRSELKLQTDELRKLNRLLSKLLKASEAIQQSAELQAADTINRMCA